MNPEEIEMEIEALVRDHKPSVERRLRRCGFAKEVAEDAIADAFLAVVKKRRRGERLDRPGAFLHAVALNSAKERVLAPHAAELPGAQAVSEAAAACDLAGTVARSVDMDRAMAQLPHRQRQVLMLRIGSDYSVSDTARILGIQEGTVGQTTTAALRNLKRIIRANREEET